MKKPPARVGRPIKTKIMKALENMTLKERALLIHQLFPLQIKDLTDYICNMTYAVRELEAANRKVWYDPELPFDRFLDIADFIRDRFHAHGRLIENDARTFSDILFNEKLLPFTAYCIRTYQQTIRHHNNRFNSAIGIFLNTTSDNHE